MRLLGLLVLSFLFCLPSLCIAEDKKTETATPSDIASVMPLQNSSPSSADITEWLSDLRRQGKSVVIVPLDPNAPTCYTMRTYTARRVSPDSDETRPFRYSTCPRASKFELRHAEGSVRDTQSDSSTR
jgi:hypothetical protein